MKDEKKDEGGKVKDESNKPQDLKVRTKDFASRIIRLSVSLPKTTEAQVLGRQVLRSGTSVGAQNPMRMSLTNLKMCCKNWMKLHTG